MKQLINEANITSQIYFFRGQKVMLDSEMASMYEVTTKRLHELVQKNSFRFPPDFMFQLTENEYEEYLKLAPLDQKKGSFTDLPYVFTEHGAVMLSSILNTQVAIETDIFVVRSFIKFRNHDTETKKKGAEVSKTEDKASPQSNDPAEKIELFFKVLLQVLESKKTAAAHKPPRAPIGFQINEVKEKESKPKEK